MDLVTPSCVDPFKQLLRDSILVSPGRRHVGRKSPDLRGEVWLSIRNQNVTDGSPALSHLGARIE